MRARALLSSLLLPAATFTLAAQAPGKTPACGSDHAGLKLPPGFCAVLVAESLAVPRHLAVAPNGDVFFAARGTRSAGGGGVYLLRDTTGDGKADIVSKFFDGPGGSGIALAPDAVYFAADERVLRFPWSPGALMPTGPADTIAKGLPVGGHAAKGIALGPDNALFVSFGSQTNSCLPQGIDRSQTRQPGPNPCTELETRAGIWRFDARKQNQTPADGKRWATGLRNAMAVTIQPGTGSLYAGVHGRDGLASQWGYSDEESAENPAEVVHALPEGTDAGWPYCYVDSRKKVRVLNPEYGGDGTKVGDCEQKAMPAVVFPGHWAPNGIAFYSGTQFPAPYHGGLFVAFHGSWNRAPLPQQGFRVAFAPFRNGAAVGSYETFMTPAAGETAIRPTGLAVGPDGSLYIGSDAQGKIWRVMYKGN